MTIDEAVRILRKLDAIWPRRQEAAEGEYDEWLDFLKLMDGPVALRAVGELRETMKWRPAMSDFKSAYRLAMTLPDASVLQLPGKTADQTTAEKNQSLYGFDPKHWVYCWRCDMAIPMEDWREDDPVRGLVHPGHKCPRRGAAPVIPNEEKLVRDEYFRKRGISLVGK